MLSSSSSELIAKVDKATSHLLIAPDWTMNMEICDAINSNQWQRKDVAKDVVKAVKKRIQHKKPTVQFLALTLLETMMKNCGDLVHFHVVDREILQEMAKIARKRTDMEVRNKILTLLDSWQEAFGGPHGKHPEYYWVYAELKKFGMEFPPHSGDAAPIFTPPITHPVGYGLQNNNSTLRLEETMSSEMGDLRLSDLDSIRRVAELLDDMLQAVNSNDPEAVKDEVIVDLVNQCRVNQKKVIHWVTSTRDEEVLAEALELNDNLQYLISKHDAIASGSEPPHKESQPTPSSDDVPPTTESQKSKQLEEHREVEEEEEDDDDGFAQLARRKSKINTDHQYIGSSPGSDVPTATTSASTTEAASSSSSNALVLSDYPDSVNTTTAKSKDQDMIDLLSLTLTTTEPSPPPTQVQDHPQNPQQPQVPQQYPANQGYAPSPYANSYVAPWAQPALPPPQQPQYPQYSYSAYPPPPWASTSSEDTMPGPSPLFRYNTFSAEANNSLGSRQLHHQSSLESRGNTPVPQGQGRVNGVAQGGATSKPYIPSYRLFEDLIDLDGVISTKKTDSSGQKSMVTGGRK